MMRWLLLPLLVVLLNACSDSDEAPGDQKKERVELEVMPCAPSYIAEQEMDFTRAWNPSPYVTYNNINSPFEGQKNLMNKSINIFFTKDGEDPMEGTFFYKHSEDKWQLSMDVTQNTYYLYGFIPKEDASSASIVSYNGTTTNGNASYSDGAELTIKGLQTVTVSDVCVLIGAKEGSMESDETIVDGNSVRLRPGSFKTNIQTTGQVGSQNYIYLLFDHIYAALRFQFKIHETYNALRTIHLRKLELMAYKNIQQEAVSAKFDAKITLYKTDDGSTPIVGSVEFTPVEASADVPPVPIFEGDEKLKTTVATSFMGCFVPGDNTYFKLRSTYDVYDKKLNYEKEANGEYKRDEHGELIPIRDKDGQPVGNLIRKDCQAENTIDLKKWFGNDLTTTRGHSYSLTLTVQPTYLYMLSEPDLDNPTLIISN